MRENRRRNYSARERTKLPSREFVQNPRSSLFQDIAAPDLGSNGGSDLDVFKEVVRKEHGVVSDVLDRQEWVWPLLYQFDEAAPKDLQSSLRSAEIVAGVLDDMNAHDPHAFPKEAYDDTVIAGGTQDISRGQLPPDVLYEVYTSGKRWRDDPEAWQWTVVQPHADESAKLIAKAGGNKRTEDMVASHHALKLRGAYALDVIRFEAIEDLVTRKGVEIIAASDVAEAVSRNKFGDGRAYLDDKEFAGRTLTDIVLGEVNVDPTIAEIAAKRTLLVKFGKLPQEM